MLVLVPLVSLVNIRAALKESLCWSAPVHPQASDLRSLLLQPGEQLRCVVGDDDVSAYAKEQAQRVSIWSESRCANVRKSSSYCRGNNEQVTLVCLQISTYWMDRGLYADTTDRFKHAEVLSSLLKFSTTTTITSGHFLAILWGLLSTAEVSQGLNTFKAFHNAHRDAEV